MDLPVNPLPPAGWVPNPDVTPLFKALRQEWIRRQSITPRYLELQAQIKAHPGPMYLPPSAAPDATTP